MTSEARHVLLVLTECCRCTSVDSSQGQDWCSTSVDSEGNHQAGQGRWVIHLDTHDTL